VSGETGTTLFASKVPIAGIAGDQQAALFGLACFEPGRIKSTYGTGCFIVANTGKQPVASKNLLTTIGWKINDEVTYALEGSIFISGALIQWLRDGHKFFTTSSEVEQWANQVTDSGGVYLVPALSGLGTPHWDSYARGLLIGMTRGTTKAHISRAALDAITFDVKEVTDCILTESGIQLKELRVDGGAASNNMLMQLQSDVLDCKVIRPKITETTALGAAYLAGLATGYWNDLEDIRKHWLLDQTFSPGADKDRQQKYFRNWKKAVERAKNWTKEIEEV
jgi:glycerol kinase